MEKYDIPYYLARTKIDIDIYNNKLDNHAEESETLNQIRTDLTKTHGVDTVYLVSLRDTGSYDMFALVGNLLPHTKRGLDPLAPSFEPAAAAWNDAWAMPVSFSPVFQCLQGKWRDDFGATYLVQGRQVHVTLKDGRGNAIDLQECSDGSAWFAGNWYVNEDVVRRAFASNSHLPWTPMNGAAQPLIWYWVD